MRDGLRRRPGRTGRSLAAVASGTPVGAGQQIGEHRFGGGFVKRSGTTGVARAHGAVERDQTGDAVSAEVAGPQVAALAASPFTAASLTGTGLVASADGLSPRLLSSGLLASGLLSSGLLGRPRLLARRRTWVGHT